jgi:hypothetical protein
VDISLEALCGYTIDEDVPRRWRLVLKALFIVSVVAVAVTMIVVTHRDPTPRRGNIHIVATLDDFTQDAEAKAPNTIPAFLALPGAVGTLGPADDPKEAVQAIDVDNLSQGFCTPSLTRLIRHDYPGYYDSWPDDKLERLALQKYPEMRDRVCTLSYKIEATPAGIIKYELKPRTLFMSLVIWLATLTITAAFTLGCMNLYYRVLVARLA